MRLLMLLVACIAAYALTASLASPSHAVVYAALPTNATVANRTAPVVNVTVDVSLTSLSYEGFSIKVINGSVKTPLNVFTLSFNVSNTIKVTWVKQNTTQGVWWYGNLTRINMTLSIMIDGVFSYSSVVSMAANSSMLINVNVGPIPYGNYTIQVSAVYGNNSLTKSYLLFMYKPRILSVWVTECGIQNLVSNNSSITIPNVGASAFNALLYSSLPVYLNLTVEGATTSIYLSGQHPIGISEPLVNGTISVMLGYGNLVYSRFTFYVNVVKPWFNLTARYGNASIPIHNGTEIYTINGIGHYLALNASYLRNLTMGIFVNGLPSGSSISLLNSGVYSVVVAFNYGLCSVYKVSFTVTAYSPTVSVTLLNSSIPIGVPIHVGLSVAVPKPIVYEQVYAAPLSSQYPVSINGSAIVEGNGTVLLSIMALQPGPIPISLTLIYSDYGGYVYSYSTVLVLNVLRPNLTIVPSRVNATYGSRIVLSVRLTSGNFSVPYQEVQYAVMFNGIYVLTGIVRTNSSGYADVRFTPNSTGLYIVYVTYEPSSSFSTTTEARVNINPAQVEISYTARSILVYGQELSLNIMVKPPINATVYIYLNSTLVSLATLINGNGSVVIRPSAAGLYGLKLWFPGTQNYLPATVEGTLLVLKAPCSVDVSSQGTYIVGNPLTILGNITAPTSYIYVYVNGSGMQVNVNGGEFSTLIIPTNPGIYNITAYWPGSQNYLSCGSSVSVNIRKAKPIVQLLVLNNNTIAVGGRLVLKVIVRVSTYEKPQTSSTLTLNLNESGLIKYINLNVYNGSLIVLQANRSGLWGIDAYFHGNTWLESSRVEPIMIYIAPGVLGIPWYIFTIYLSAILLGVVIAEIIRRL